MKRRIGIFLASVPQDGGAFQYSLSVLTAVSELNDRDHEIVALCTNKSWPEHIRRSGLPVLCRPVRRTEFLLLKCVKFGLLPLKLWRSICTRISPVTKLLVEQHCDLWVFPSQDEWAYAVPVNALTAIHDLMHRYEPQFPEVSRYCKHTRRELHYSKLCQWAKGLLVDSQIGKQQVIRSYDVVADSIYILPFVAPNYIYARVAAEDFDSKYKLPKKFIFYPAQFWKHKNHERLIEALALLQDDIPDMQLVFVGSKKNNYESVFDLAERLGVKNHVHVLDYVPNDEIGSLYRKARAMVMPTFFGPTNIPPLEAFATGCPVAVSNIYGMPEQVGDAALLFDPTSTEDLARTLRRLWLDDRLCKHLSEKGKTRDRSWNQQQFNRQVSNIIDQMMIKLQSS